MKMALTALVVVLVSSHAAYGQMAKWAMRPGYDSIRLAAGVPVILTDSAGTTSLWSTDARLLASTTDSVAPFSNGFAVVLKKGTTDITGFYATDGTFTKLQGCKAVYGCPYFRDGYLLVDKQGRHKLICTDGSGDPFGSFVTMYPYTNGYACCTMYRDMENLEGTYYYYVDTDKNPIKLMLNKEDEAESDEVSFLSSLNDDGLGIAIVKRRVYMYDKGLGMLRPVFVDDKAEKKRQVRVGGHFSESMYMEGDTTVVWARASKKDTVFFRFDKMMRLVSVKYPKRTDTYHSRHIGPLKLKGDFAAEKREGGKYAVTQGQKTILPPQFEGGGISVGKYLAVRKDGKWGMLEIDENASYRMSMNKGNAIAFRHQKYETTVRLDLPADIKAEVCSFDIPSGNGCTIDKTSVQTRNTDSGNFVQYNCVLSIPDSLPDHIIEITYPVHVECDGIAYSENKLAVKAWHYKYVNMDLSRDETKFDGGNVEFIINMTTDKLAGENDYPLTVRVAEDSTAARVDLVKLSETRYKCRLYQPVEGINRVVVSVTEHGCPPSYFPFEINYIKPKDNTAVGQVEVTKSGMVQQAGMAAAATSTGGTTAVPAATTTAPAGTVTVPPAPVQLPNTMPQSAVERTTATPAQMPQPTAQQQNAAAPVQATTAPAATQTQAPATAPAAAPAPAGTATSQTAAPVAK